MLLLKASSCPQSIVGAKNGGHFAKQEKGKDLKTERNFWDRKVLWFVPEEFNVFGNVLLDTDAATLLEYFCSCWFPQDVQKITEAEV